MFQTNGFSSTKMFEFQLEFHWSLFPRVQLTIFQHWFRQWLGAVQATSRYLNQWWLVYQRIYASLGLNELSERPKRIDEELVEYNCWRRCLCRLSSGDVTSPEGQMACPGWHVPYGVSYSGGIIIHHVYSHCYAQNSSNLVFQTRNLSAVDAQLTTDNVNKTREPC